MSTTPGTNIIPITDEPCPEPELDPAILKVVVGGSRHILNWRTGEIREPADPVPFPPAQKLFLAEGLAKELAQSDPCPDRKKRRGETKRMKRFSISLENQVTLLAEGEAEAPGSTTFASEEELHTVTSHWPMTRLVEIWNGASPAKVRKFKDRKSAVSRLWNHAQSLEPVAKPAKAAKSKPADSGATGESKKDQVLALLRAPGGATLAQLMEKTGWQKHSVRGFLSGMVHKKMGLTVSSSKNKEGERVYRVKK